MSASATLSYAYGDRIVWVDALSSDAHPMTHDLCEDHATTLRVPNGWSCRDRRDGAASASTQLRLGERVPA